MASLVVKHLQEAFPDHKTGIAFLYCSYSRHEKQKVINLLSALLNQLVQQQSSIPEPVKTLYGNHIKCRARPSLSELSDALLSVVKSYSRVFIIIDALDECRDNDGTSINLLSEIRSLQTHSDTKLMATSRFIATIMQEFKEDISLEIRASSSDVGQYLEGQMSRLPKIILRSPSLPQLIKAAVTEAADGM